MASSQASDITTFFEIPDRHLTCLLKSAERTGHVLEYIKMFGTQPRQKDNDGLEGDWSYPADFVEIDLNSI